MSESLFVWAVGPDPEGRWHLAVAPRQPAPWMTTGTEAVCGYPPPDVTEDMDGQLCRVWPNQKREPLGDLVCALCAAWARRRFARTLPGLAV